jgi:branched-chain amino acid transport system substrate-binding protein
MKKTGGKWPGAEEFSKVLATITLDTIRGPVRLDEQFNPVQNIYIRKVEKKQLFGYPNGELWNTVIKTYENVGQYWTYNKEEFLKQPVYSRDFPPCKHCE